MPLDDSLVSNIFKDLSFSLEETHSIAQKLECKTLQKGENLLQAGDKVLSQYFVFSGCLRAYYIDDLGKEHTVQFAIHDWWISDYTAFFTGAKAILNVEVLEDAVLYGITRRDMENLYLEVPRLETFFRKKMEKSFASFQKRILGNLSQSAKERYLTFISTYPNMAQSVKNYHIASYLGITTESLSRIRKEIATH